MAIYNLASVAMESSGLISFREDRIIYDDTIATTYQKQQFADIVAHEIAHSCELNSKQDVFVFLEENYLSIQGLETMLRFNGGMIFGLVK